MSELFNMLKRPDLRSAIVGAVVERTIQAVFLSAALIFSAYVILNVVLDGSVYIFIG